MHLQSTISARCGLLVLAGLAWFGGAVAAEDPPADKRPDIDGIVTVLNDSVNRRLEGLAGGEAQMALFSIYDHTCEAYSRNEDLWCAGLADELNGVVVYKGGPGQRRGVADSYGGVMITPRHVLFCNHAHPAYPGSPPPWVRGLGFRLRFVTATSGVIQRELVWGQRVAGQDLWIGLLDEDLPPMVKSYRLFPDLDESLGRAPVRALEVGFSQGSARLSPAANHTKFQQLCGRRDTSHYGTQSEVDGVEHYSQVPMVYVAEPRGTKVEDAPEGRERFHYCVWDGDSGTPRFHLFGDELLLSRIVLTAGGGGVALGDKVELLNETIRAIDLEAVEQERLEEITGHEVAVASRQELRSGPSSR